MTPRRTQHFLCIVVVAIACASFGVQAATDEGHSIDAFQFAVNLTTGTHTWARNDYAPSSLTSFSNAVCNALTPSVSTTSGSTAHCFLNFDAAPIVAIHLMTATVAETQAYQTQMQLTTWTGSSGFSTQTQTVQQLAYAHLGIPAIQVQFAQATLQNPCRSRWTVPGATTRPPVTPIICQGSGTTPTSFSFGVRTSSTTITTTALRDAIWTSAVVPIGQTTCTVQADCLTVTVVSDGWYKVTMAQTLSLPFRVMVNTVTCLRDRSCSAITNVGIRDVTLVTGDMSTATYEYGKVNIYSEPEVMYCNPFYDYWAFILLILGPVGYILFRQSYHAGKKKGMQEGKEAIETAQEEQELEERVEDEVAEIGEIEERRQQNQMLDMKPPQGISEEQYRQMMMMFFMQQQQQTHQQR